MEIGNKQTESQTPLSRLEPSIVTSKYSGAIEMVPSVLLQNGWLTLHNKILDIELIQEL